MLRVMIGRSYAAWARAAGHLVAQEIPPGEVMWADADGGAGLLELGARWEAPAGDAETRWPADFAAVAEMAARHRSGERWAAMYRMLWRMMHGERHLLQIEVDEDCAALVRMEREVGKDKHRMIGFARFREVRMEDAVHMVCWYRPDHYVLPLVAPHFARRYAGFRWSILTPDESAYWDGTQLRYGGGVPRPRETEDGLQELWRTYYASAFNPARASEKGLRQHMPVRFHEALPEAREVERLLREAPGKLRGMVERDE